MDPDALQSGLPANPYRAIRSYRHRGQVQGTLHLFKQCCGSGSSLALQRIHTGLFDPTVIGDKFKVHFTLLKNVADPDPIWPSNKSIQDYLILLSSGISSRLTSLFETVLRIRIFFGQTRPFFWTDAELFGRI
jgi:hypothetical protein